MELMIPTATSDQQGQKISPCTNPHRRVLQNVQTPGRHATIALDCGRWCCAGCAARLTAQWTDHLKATFSEHAEEGGQFFSLECSRKQWDTIHKAIRRARGKHVRVLRRDRTVLCVLTVAVASAVALCGDGAALGLVKKALEQHSYRKPVATCKAWQLRKAPKEPKKWRAVGKLAVSLEVAQEVLRQQGIDGYHFKRRGVAGLLWNAPDPVVAEVIREQLLTGKILPPSLLCPEASAQSAEPRKAVYEWPEGTTLQQALEATLGHPPGWEPSPDWSPPVRFGLSW